MASAAVARTESRAAEAVRESETTRRAADRGRARPKPAPALMPRSTAVIPATTPATLSLARSTLLSTTRIQPALMISQPGDAAEMEADRVAAAIVSMPEPSAKPGLSVARSVQRSPLIVQRAGATPAATAENVADAATEEAVKKELGGGAPMSPDVAGFYGRRFKASFGDVRIHTDGKAGNLSTRLGARAFTYGRHIFFNAGQYNPESADGAKLLAHELTHTIQQQAVIQRKESGTAAPRVTGRSRPQAQRGIVSRALNWVADKANYIPGFRLFTIIIGTNPVNMSKVDRSGANILRALVEFIPFGGAIVDALDNHGIFEKGGKFIEDQFRTLGMVGSAFRDALMEFIDSLGWSDIFDLGGVWNRGVRIFTAPIDRIISFAKGLVSGIGQIIKDAILKPLGKYAAGIIPKFDLLAGVFGKNPVSGESVSPADALIGGFMALINQSEIYENIKKGNAVSKAWAWFKGALGQALALVTSIPGEFIATLKSLTITDIITIVGAWGKFAKLFLGFVGKFISWAGSTILNLLEIILSVVAPTMVPYLKKAGAAFGTIIKAPGRFIGTLIKAGRQGFGQFAKNILAHLQRGILDWLLGSLGGANLYLPKSFDLRELLKFGLSVVGLTWINVRAKLVAATNETTVVALEKGFELVKTLVTEGPAAAWKQLLESLSNLKSMVMDAIIDYVKGKVIEIAIEKLLSFLTPAGAFIQAILAIYRTITFIVGQLKRIGALVAAFIDGIAAMAAGAVAPAANRVENVLARGLSLAINFLANFAGLGNVSKKVIEIINKIRAPVDKAIDKVVAWIVDQAKKVGKFVIGGAKSAVAAVLKAIGISVSFSAGGESHRLWVDVTKDSPRVMMASVTKPLSQHLVDYDVKAGKLTPAAKKAATKKAIANVSPKVTEIEAHSVKAKKSTTTLPERAELDGKVTKIEHAIRDDMILILTNVGVTVPEEIKPAIKVPFEMGPALTPADKGEYVRQLAMQEAGINGMTVAQWLRNRSRFEAGGRDPRSATAQKDVRKAVQLAMEKRLLLPEKSKAKTPGLGAHELSGISAIFQAGTDVQRADGFSDLLAARRAATWMAGQRALHSPDQVAGGEFDELTGMGTTRVNSSIGSNWGSRKLADNLQSDVKKWLKGPGEGRPVAEEFFGVVKMKVRLTI